MPSKKLIRFKELPPGFKRGRHYLWQKTDSGFEIEDINIAASLIVHGYEYKNKKIVQEFLPGKFMGTKFGKRTNSGELIFKFCIEGNPDTLNRRRLLFHAGAHLVDSSDYKKARDHLLDTITQAKRDAKKRGLIENGEIEDGR